jgi:DNA-binding response OmpR family regulator
VSATTPRVLIADDSQIVARLIERHFQALGWEVTAVRDGLDALDRGMKEDFDLMFLDQLMPTMLGVEVLQLWREAGVDAPVIMLSGVDDEKMIIRCLELGANDFLHKPVNLKELEVRARVHLARRGISLTA